MDLTSYDDLKNLFKKYNIWAKKRLGQHFLTDKNVLKNIQNTANLHPEDIVIEVGPGHGVLTRELLPHVQKVCAIEIDEDILPVLRETTRFFRDKLEIYHEHILNFHIPDIPYKVVANIPYYLTSPLLRKFLVEAKTRPTSLTLLMQKEVAEKICNTKKKSILSLFVEVFGEAHIVQIVPPQSFFPAPKVESAVLHISVSASPKITISPSVFFQVVKMGFAQPRKKLKNNLSKDIITLADIDENLRPENLSIENWENITKVFLDQK